METLGALVCAAVFAAAITQGLMGASMKVPSETA